MVGKEDRSKWTPEDFNKAHEAVMVDGRIPQGDYYDLGFSVDAEGNCIGHTNMAYDEKWKNVPVDVQEEEDGQLPS